MLTRQVRVRLLSPRGVERISYPTLRLIVQDIQDHHWLVPTLAEGIAHLKSSEGRRLIIRCGLTDHTWNPGDRATEIEEDSSRIVIHREGDRIVIEQLQGGNFDFACNSMPQNHDLTRDGTLDSATEAWQLLADLTLCLSTPN